ncbi:MAG: isochorismatase family protein [Kofleriaceae bacterium]|nr:isochorismatase family protein [Kofleriaceae bacterium]
MQLKKEESVLLIVDIQEKLAAAMPEKIMKKTIKNCQILLEAARRMGIPVVVSEQ